jgi:hypothetical protein
VWMVIESSEVRRGIASSVRAGISCGQAAADEGPPGLEFGE